MRKLDFHYYFQGEDLEKPLLKELVKFPNLEDLRFGESELSVASTQLLKKCAFPKLTHLTAPLFKNAEHAAQFLDLLPDLAPAVTSMTLQDPSYEGPSYTEKVAPKLNELGITKLRFRVHEASNKESMRPLIETLLPKLT